MLCRAKKEASHWSIVVCEGYCIQCSFSMLDSGESPLGKALLGHKKGERVYIPVNPQYGYYVEIKEIRVL